MYCCSSMGGNKVVVAVTAILFYALVAAAAQTGEGGNAMVKCTSDCYYECMQMRLFSWNECKKECALDCGIDLSGMAEEDNVSSTKMLRKKR